MDVEVCLMQPHKKVQVIETRMRKRWHIEMEGPDGGRAWCVALAACLINFIMNGLGRMAGVLYVALIEMFGINRQTATTPFSIRSSTRNILGPVVGILGQQYGVRTVTIMGGVFGTISSAACFFANDMNWITVLWGGFNGIGTALTTTLPQVVIGQYFKKHHTTASGLAFSGGCVGAFLFPVLIEYLLQNYGLQGTFLILSGVIMHAIPAAMLLRKPPWLKESSRKASQASEHQKASEATKNQKANLGIQYETNLAQNGMTKDNHTTNETVPHEDVKFHWFQQDMNLVAEVVYSAIQQPLPDTSYEHKDIKNSMSDNLDAIDAQKQLIFNILSDMYDVALRKLQYDNKTVMLKNYSSDSVKVKDICDTVTIETLRVKNCILKFVEELENFSVLEDCVNLLQTSEHSSCKDNVHEILLELCEVSKLYIHAQSRKSTDVDITIDLETRNNSGKVVKNEDKTKKRTPDLVVKVPSEGFMKHIKTAMKLFTNPVFILICTCRAVHFMTFVPVVTVIVDFGMDNGLAEEDGKYIIGGLSAGDFAGRLCLGWLTDNGYVSLPKYMLFVMVLQGATTAALPFMTTKWSMMCMFALFGMLQGSVFIRHPVLVTRYTSSEGQSIAMGCINFWSGVLGFSLPYYIGYFRDTLGSYNLMFYITGCIGSSVGLIWAFEPYFNKCVDFDERQQKEDEEAPPYES